MPIYTYYCKNCRKRVERFLPMSKYENKQMCEKCRGVMERRISKTFVEIFRPFWCEDLDVKPIWIESKKQLKEEANKRNLIAAGL